MPSVLRPRSIFAVALVALAYGCDADPQVRVYEVDLLDPAAQVAGSTPAAGSPTDNEAGEATRMLGAIVPMGERAVFVKMTGRPDALDQYKAAIADVALSLKEDGGEIAFDPPEGWTRLPGNSIAFAKLQPPEEAGIDGPMTLSALNASQDVTEYRSQVQGNLDRWRGQLQLPSVPLAQEASSEVQTVGPDTERQTYLIDYRGQGSGQMTPPFANRLPPRDELPSSDVGQTEFADREVQLANPNNPVSNASESLDARQDAMTLQKPEVTFDTPEGWVNVGTDSQSLRAASLRTGDGPEAGDISVTFVGADAAGAVGMWASSVRGDGDEASTKELLESAEAIETADGRTGQLYVIVPEETRADSKGIIGVVVPADGKNAFIKLTAPAGEIDTQLPAFKEFVRSMRWKQPTG